MKPSWQVKAKMDVNRKTILVTGGSRGIGKEIARVLVAKGANVIIVGSNREHLDKTVAELGPAVTAIQADLADRQAVLQLIEQVADQYPFLAGLINNAGIQTRMNFLDDNVSNWIAEAHREVSINLDAAIALCIGLLPVFRKQKESLILNVTTGLAIAPKQSSPVYCATKAGLRNFTQTLRYQCQDFAVHVQVADAILTIVDTKMTKGYGRGKISPQRAAEDIVKGLEANKSEIWIGTAKLLRVIYRLAPGVAARIMRRR